MDLSFTAPSTFVCRAEGRGSHGLRTHLHTPVLESGLEDSWWWEAACRKARSRLRTGPEGWGELIAGMKDVLGRIISLIYVGPVGAPSAAPEEAKRGLHLQARNSGRDSGCYLLPLPRAEDRKKSYNICARSYSRSWRHSRGLNLPPWKLHPS